MDTELFQWVLLGLVALAVVALLALLATLSGIRKALERGASPTSTATAGEPPREPAGVHDADETAADPAEEAPSSDRDTSSESETATASAARPATEAEGRAGSIRSVLEQHGLGEPTTTSQGVDAGGAQPAADQAQPAADQPAEEPVVDSAFAAHADDPQDEPFQRDGRWWFRRGDELLLYDETSGQWQPAPDPGPASMTVGAADDAGGAGSAGIEGGVETTPVTETPPVADDVATFWKCPTCGAVNGSTAATCRMCFAARP